MSLFFVRLLPARQMFVCYATNKEKASYAHSHAEREREREDTAERDTFLELFFPSDQEQWAVTTFDGQEDSSCGLHCA